ncbi:MAG TPA: GAF domain-containing sensor histidine kinase, partial [Myxococcota bacterium]|nr:GAF domain-containing sensor histidine kinase [Myxococcota bacterium]
SSSSSPTDQAETLRRGDRLLTKINVPPVAASGAHDGATAIIQLAALATVAATLVPNPYFVASILEALQGTVTTLDISSDVRMILICRSAVMPSLLAALGADRAEPERRWQDLTAGLLVQADESPLSGLAYYILARRQVVGERDPKESFAHRGYRAALRHTDFAAAALNLNLLLQNALMSDLRAVGEWAKMYHDMLFDVYGTEEKSTAEAKWMTSPARILMAVAAFLSAPSQSTASPFAEHALLEMLSAEGPYSWAYPGFLAPWKMVARGLEDASRDLAELVVGHGRAALAVISFASLLAGAVLALLMDIWKTHHAWLTPLTEPPHAAAWTDFVKVSAVELELGFRDHPGAWEALQTWLAAERACAGPDAGAETDVFAFAQGDLQSIPWPWARGLILERAARFYRARGARDTADACARRAIEAYVAWGGVNKGMQLRAEFENALPGAHLPRPVSAQPKAAARSTFDSALRPYLRFMEIARSLQASPDDALPALAQLICDVSGAQRCALVYAAATTSTFRVLINFPDPPPGTDASESLPLALLRYAALGRAQLTGDADAAQNVVRDAYIARVQPRSIHCVGLAVQGKGIGGLYLEHADIHDAFAEAQLQLAQVAAAQGLSAREIADLRENLQGRVDEVSRHLKAAQDRIVALQQGRVEERLSGGFAHEMLNKLTAARMNMVNVVGNAAMGLPRLIPQILAASSLEAARSDLQQVDDVSRAVSELLDLSIRVTERTLAYGLLSELLPPHATCNVLEVVQQVVTKASLPPGILVVCTVPSPSDVRVAQDHLETVVTELLDNARLAVERVRQTGREARVEITWTPETHTLQIADNGVGVVQDEAHRMFEPFFSTRGAHGAGLGLATVRKLVAVYGGTVSYRSEPGVGATFFVTLPSR